MTREAIEVRDVNNEVTEYVDEDEIKRQRALKSPKQKKQKERKTTDRRTYKKRDRFVEIDQVLRETSHDAMSHCGDHTLDETITRQVMDGTEALTTSGRLKRALGPLGKRKCKHCEAGWAQK
jgi:hypothetical protein